MRSFDDPPRVVICTMFERPEYVRALTGVGASAHVVKSSSAEHLVAAMRAAVLDQEGGNVVVGMPTAMIERAEGGSEGPLTGRELEILLLTSRGLSNGRVASALHIAEGTVKRHLANVYQKMGVGSRGQAMREAPDEGLDHHRGGQGGRAGRGRVGTVPGGRVQADSPCTLAPFDTSFTGGGCLRPRWAYTVP
jgi:DNA-binding NarL/FixJ family response regulator